MSLVTVPPARRARTALRAAAAGAAVAAAALVGAPAASAETPPAPAPQPSASQIADSALTARPARRSPTLVRTFPSDLGLLARRAFNPKIVAQCNHWHPVWINGNLFVLADFGGGAQLDGVDTVKALRAGGFTWDEMTVAVAVASAESDRCPRAVHHNLDPMTGATRSTDYGLWQINTYYHPQYASWDLMDPVVSSTAAKQIKDRAKGWKPWHGYANKDLFMDFAEQAVKDAKAAGIR